MSSKPVALQVPFTKEQASTPRAGTKVLISGQVYGARDAAHKRLVELLRQSKELPVVLQDQVIYYVGPAPAKAGQVIGPAGPTTSSRMDPYTLPLLQQGVRGLIGKGYRSPEVKAALTEYGAVYFGTIGGAAALLAQRIQASRVVAFEDLGPEALFAFEFANFPAIVVNDVYGSEAYVRPIADDES
ncbi:MAG TPA: FumA C-terminus/TtdB family hydratase beta subunit [Ktedonobacteraceae bacterium]|jgi:fumarate hydratase subunit beta